MVGMNIICSVHLVQIFETIPFFSWKHGVNMGKSLDSNQLVLLLMLLICCVNAVVLIVA